jgi:hypothetical protein
VDYVSTPPYVFMAPCLVKHRDNLTSYLYLSGILRTSSSGIWRRVALVRTDVSEECVASIIRMKRISELGSTLSETGNAYIILTYCRHPLRYLLQLEFLNYSHRRLQLNGRIPAYLANSELTPVDVKVRSLRKTRSSAKRTD